VKVKRQVVELDPVAGTWTYFMISRMVQINLCRRSYRSNRSYTFITELKLVFYSDTARILPT